MASPVSALSAQAYFGDNDLLAAQTGGGAGVRVRGWDVAARRSNGRFGINNSAPAGDLTVSPAANPTSVAGCRTLSIGEATGNGAYGLNAGMFLSGGVWRGSIDTQGGGAADLVLQGSGGNLLVGVAAGTTHTIYKGAGEGQHILFVNAATHAAARFMAVASENFSGAATAMFVGRNTSTGRSINAGGTINASGADYAEYMRKAPGCGTIAPGDVCGVDRNGLLTRTWADALSFMIKSTNPGTVGGDTWGQDLGPRPEAPLPVGEEPTLGEAADAASIQAYQQAFAEWHTARAAYEAALVAFETALPAWEAAFEAERQKVDRIAYVGQVPVNVSPATLSEIDAALGDGEAVYLVAVALGGGIAAEAVRESAMTLPLYMRRLGKALSVADSRPIVDVQHG